MQDGNPLPAFGTTKSDVRLSYKFQRLREEIRQAVLSGEFGERLPGERELGRRYRANAKTINKALSDLSSDGLLVRHIGRGTYIAAAGESPAASGRTRTFQCFLSTHNQGDHRQPLLAEIKQRLAERGHSFVATEITPDRGSDVSLSAWPAASRRTTDGVICYPAAPLSDGCGQLAADCIAELHRRHVPAVVIGACGDEAKLNSVTPDYSDGGFRIGEYLFNSGCASACFVASAEAARDVEWVATGLQTAAARHGRETWRINLNDDAIAEGVSSIERRAAQSGKTGDDRLGLVCVGGRILRHLLSSKTLTELRSRGNVLLTAIVEPGDPAGREAGITTYEVDLPRMADWVVRLLLEARPGQKPVEIIVPGLLHIREASRSSHAMDSNAPNVTHRVLADATV